MQKNGFTLAEVLIALALLGVVAAFSVPKVMQAVGEQKKIAILKETVSALSEISYKSALNNDLVPRFAGKSGKALSQEVARYYSERLNTLTFCPDHAEPQGAGDPDCWVEGTSSGLANADQPAMILPNGLYLLDFEYRGSTPNTDVIWIDYNGKTGPNKVGEDEIGLNIFWGDGVDQQQSGAFNVKGGKISCAYLSDFAAFSADNAALCRKVLQ